MSQLIELLIDQKISLNELKDWINLSSNEEKLLKTTKYEFISYLLSNIRLSTDWLTTVFTQNTLNSNQINSQNNSPIKLSSNESNINYKYINNKSNELIDKKQNNKNRKLITIKDLTKKVENFDLNDENLFPTLGSEGVDSKCVANNTNILSETSVSVNTVCRRKRRIKPTAVKGDDQQISLGFFANSRDSKGKPIRKDWIKNSNNVNIFQMKSNNNNNINSECYDSLKADREWLKRAKANEKCFNKTVIDINSLNNDSIKLESNTSKLVTIEANFDLITSTDKLNLISDIYAIILKSNFVNNFFDELKFICELLTKRVAKEYNQEVSHPLDSIFSSYHNCVYFSVRVLEELLVNYGLISCLNRTSLKLLTETWIITNFSPLLKEKLLSVLESYKPINSANENHLKTTLLSVLFQSETDNKCNFPNDSSFHSFRKQRDEFYQIYNNYRQENNTIKSCKDSNLKFINSIKHLLSLSRDSANMSHLSRLFVSQLLQSCVNRQLGSENSDFNEEAVDENETVRKLMTDREKLKKLEKRFNKSSPMLSDTNTFLKEELFFRDFIIYGDSHAFNEHLKLLLSDKLLEFNSNEMLNFDNDLSEIQVLRNRFKNTLITLKVVSKFLAYVTFYPFFTTLSNNNAQEFIESQTRIRSDSKPIIALEECLRQAIDRKRLLVTIPWVVEFLSFIDPISTRTVYYENIYNLLVVIYKSYLPKIIQFVPINGFFILFYMTRTLTHKNFYNNNNRFNQTVFSVCNEIPIINSSDNSIDFIRDLMDNEFLHDLCPQLNDEMAQIFKQNIVSEVRKITPLTMPFIEKNKQLNVNKAVNSGEQLLKLQIEEQFFSSHSPSLKKTVDFVSDRITSKCVKKIRSEIFVRLKQPYIESYVREESEANILDITIEIQSECKNFVNQFCVQQINTIFPLLMNDDIDESVSQFSIKIAIKLTIDKCFEWIDNNITQSLIKNDLKTESENRKKQTNEEIEDKELLHVIDISSTLGSIRDVMADLYENKSISESSIVKLVNQLSHLKRSKTLSKKTLDFIDVNIVDFAIALIANEPKLLNGSIIKLFIDYWLEFNIIVEKFICPRNLYILFKCKSPLISWSKFESFLLNMLSNRIITTQIIENDSLWTLKEEWNDSVLNRFASCLKSVVDYNEKHSKPDNNDLLNTIDWLSWFCSQSDQ